MIKDKFSFQLLVEYEITPEEDLTISNMYTNINKQCHVINSVIKSV